MCLFCFQDTYAFVLLFEIKNPETKTLSKECRLCITQVMSIGTILDTSFS